MVGNPIANQNPQLARIENNGDALRDVLYDYFSGDGGAQVEATGYNTASASMRGNNFAGTTAGMGGSFDNKIGGAGGFLGRSGGGAASNNDLNDRFDAMDVNDRSMKHANSG